MINHVFSFLNQKYMAIIEKIKAFTFTTPSNRGIADPDYKCYLAQCSELFELDRRLHNLCYMYDFDDSDDFAEIEEQLLEIDKKVDEIIK